MSDLGAAWLGDDGAECLTRDQWEGRITEVNPEPDGEGDWWFSAIMIPVDGIGSARTDAFMMADVPEPDRKSVCVGIGVRTLHETVRSRGGVEGRFALRLRSTGTGREAWSGAAE